jgi:hypothetical protein
MINLFEKVKCKVVLFKYVPHHGTYGGDEVQLHALTSAALAAGKVPPVPIGWEIG